MSTDETKTQMDPAIPHFQAFLTAISARRNLLYLIKMCTVLCHVFSPSGNSPISWEVLTTSSHLRIAYYGILHSVGQNMKYPGNCAGARCHRAPAQFPGYFMRCRTIFVRRGTE